MTFLKIVFLCVVGMSVLEADSMNSMSGCSKMTPEMQLFASEMAPNNQKMFCEQFTEGQRASAMEMASAQNMTPDAAVEKVASAGGLSSQKKTPVGCPVK